MKRAHAQHDRSSERVEHARRGLSGDLTASYPTIFHRDEAACAHRSSSATSRASSLEICGILSTPCSSAGSPPTIVGAWANSKELRAMTVIDLKQRIMPGKPLKRPASSLFSWRKFWQRTAAAGWITLARIDIEYIAQWNRWLQRAVSGNRDYQSRG